jgi:hypothetical protein
MSAWSDPDEAAMFAMRDEGDWRGPPHRPEHFCQYQFWYPSWDLVAGAMHARDLDSIPPWDLESTQTITFFNGNYAYSLTFFGYLFSNASNPEADCRMCVIREVASQHDSWSCGIEHLIRQHRASIDFMRLHPWSEYVAIQAWPSAARVRV